MADPQQLPKWFTPVRLLVLFCVVNLLNYFDRGIIASNGVNGAPGQKSGIQGDFKLSNFQDGVLSSAFMGGLLVSSPIFAELTKTCNPFRLIGVGLSVWTIATAGCGFSFGFWSITLFRTLVGVGEASFVSLAAPFIEGYAPKEKRSTWIAYFYMCMPVGVALGYVFGGLIGTSLHWRAAFLLEALLMLPFAIGGFLSDPLDIPGTPEEDAESEYMHLSDMEAGKNTPEQNEQDQHKGAIKGVYEDFKELFRSKVYVVNVLGYIAFNFVLGAYSYWGPKAGEAIYHMASADIMFGAVTIVCGIAGTFAGGKIHDYIGSTIRNGFKILAIATCVGGVACFFAFLSKSLVLFIILFAIGELFLFATQGPVNQVNLNSFPKKLKPLAMATCTVFIHILGDVPSSPLVGLLEDKIHNWRTTALILTSIYLLAALIWLCGYLLFLCGYGYEKEQVQDDKDNVRSRSDEEHLIQGQQ